MKHLWLWIGLIAWAGMTSCTQQAKELKTGAWHFDLALNQETNLPFTATLTQVGAGYMMKIHNDSEDILVSEITRWGDSILMRMPVFESEFRGQIMSETEIQGLWYEKSRGPDYQLPFIAKAGDQPRFEVSQNSPVDIAPVWEVMFSEGTDDSVRAIGEFVQDGTQLKGTFLTETGDYRFLEGVVDGEEIKLSAFDGSHAFLFTATLDDQGQLTGEFLSGNHWEEPWIASPNPEAKLRPAESLTYLNEGYDKLSFSFPDLEGNMVSLSDDRFANKVVIVQILGSWCPNCMDETKLYAKWYEKYHDRGLEIVGLAYERIGDMDKAVKSVSRMKSQLKANYPMLIASISDDKMKAAETLPMLNHVLSYPTSIYIDRDGTIRKIHTGFYGPSTGDRYVRFVEEYTTFLENLLGRESSERFAGG